MPRRVCQGERVPPRAGRCRRGRSVPPRRGASRGRGSVRGRRAGSRQVAGRCGAGSGGASPVPSAGRCPGERPRRAGASPERCGSHINQGRAPGKGPSFTGRCPPCARVPAASPRRRSESYTCLALGGAAAAAAALSGVPDPRALGLSPVGRVPGRRGALRGSGLPQRSLNTLLFLAGRPESGRGPALPPPPSNGEAAPGPRPLLAVTCRPGAEEAPESLAVPARAVTKRRPPAPG